MQGVWTWQSPVSVRSLMADVLPVPVNCKQEAPLSLKRPRFRLLEVCVCQLNTVFCWETRRQAFLWCLNKWGRKLINPLKLFCLSVWMNIIAAVSHKCCFIFRKQKRYIYSCSQSFRFQNLKRTWMFADLIVWPCWGQNGPTSSSSSHLWMHNALILEADRLQQHTRCHC